MTGAITDRIRHLRLTLGLSGVALLLAAGVGAVTAGGTAALGAAAGVAVVAASYAASTLAIAWADSITPRMVMGVGIGMYVLKYTLLGLLLVAINDAQWPGRIAMAWGIALGVVVWTASQIRWMVRHAHPYVEVPRTPDRTADTEA